jgi:hypothetical protein
MICHNTSNKPTHHSKDCPILKKIGLKLVKRTPANGDDVASRVGQEAPPPAPPTAPPAAPNPLAKNGGSAGTPGAFTAATESNSYDLGDDFDYEGKYEGKVYSNGNSKSNVPVYPCASHASVNNLSPDLPPVTTSCRRSTSSIDPKGIRTVRLPKLVTALLNNPLAHSIAFMSSKLWPRTSLLVANTGATDHMIPDKSAFISYRPVSRRHVRMGNNLFAPILGTESAIISLNGKRILIRDCLHVPAL